MPLYRCSQTTILKVVSTLSVSVARSITSIRYLVQNQACNTNRNVFCQFHRQSRSYSFTHLRDQLTPRTRDISDRMDADETVQPGNGGVVNKEKKKAATTDGSPCGDTSSSKEISDMSDRMDPGMDAEDTEPPGNGGVVNKEKKKATTDRLPDGDISSSQEKSDKIQTKDTSDSEKSQPEGHSSHQAQDESSEELSTEKILKDHIRGAIYGNCAGDAIGLLTEFMSKQHAHNYYGEHVGQLEYDLKVHDGHRSRWKVGDWTDDSDQMILIMDVILENYKVDAIKFAEKMRFWVHRGFPECGDQGGLGIGSTTWAVLGNKHFLQNPVEIARKVWESSGRFLAPNGAVMRTSILGAYHFSDMDEVHRNTLEVCKVTHADPRCQASCIAVTTAIALMLQRKSPFYENGKYNTDKITQQSFIEAKLCLESFPEDQPDVKELEKHIYAMTLSELELDDHHKIGYTYKAMGAGFWALRQDDFRKAMEDITMEAGDADTNGAVAGALLGCKLGYNAIPESWREKFPHKLWLDEKVERFMKLVHSPKIDGTKASPGNKI